MTTRTVPFDGNPLDVAKDDVIEVRTAQGDWVQLRAAGPPHYDLANAVGRCHLTVPVVLPDRSIVNWPAEAVRVLEVDRG